MKLKVEVLVSGMSIGVKCYWLNSVNYIQRADYLFPLIVYRTSVDQATQPSVNKCNNTGHHSLLSVICSVAPESANPAFLSISTRRAWDLLLTAMNTWSSGSASADESLRLKSEFLFVVATHAILRLPFDFEITSDFSRLCFEGFFLSCMGLGHYILLFIDQSPHNCSTGCDFRSL